MIIEKVREYFFDCPLINQRSQINVDYLGVKAVEYTIDAVPVEPILKPYVDGGALKQFVFVFGSREYYGADVLQNMENSGFYQLFREWIEKQNKDDTLPILSEGKTSTELKVLTQGYLFDSSEEHARYQIQVRLTYYEDK